MIETLISSKTRIKLLLKFFLNSRSISYLRGLESEFGESSNAIRLELNRFEKAGMLKSFTDGNKKFFQANTDHPLFKEVNTILMKYIGFDRIIDTVIERLGEIREVYIIGQFSKGLDSPVIDLMFTGDIDENYLVNLIHKAEDLIHRKIRYIIYRNHEVTSIDWKQFDPQPLLLWSKDA
ncbi:MAG TPA: hypothetical protein VJ508_18265 [Saprospiraceae bacterium]|nr:hypothetical protein [Saprospiraceae bacterium]